MRYSEREIEIGLTMPNATLSATDDEGSIYIVVKIGEKHIKTIIDQPHI